MTLCVVTLSEPLSSEDVRVQTLAVWTEGAAGVWGDLGAPVCGSGGHLVDGTEQKWRTCACSGLYSQVHDTVFYFQNVLVEMGGAKHLPRVSSAPSVLAPGFPGAALIRGGGSDAQDHRGCGCGLILSSSGGALQLHTRVSLTGIPLVLPPG